MFSSTTRMMIWTTSSFNTPTRTNHHYVQQELQAPIIIIDFKLPLSPSTISLSVPSNETFLASSHQRDAQTLKQQHLSTVDSATQRLSGTGSPTPHSTRRATRDAHGHRQTIREPIPSTAHLVLSVVHLAPPRPSVKHP